MVWRAVIQYYLYLTCLQTELHLFRSTWPCLFWISDNSGKLLGQISLKLTISSIKKRSYTDIASQHMYQARLSVWCAVIQYLGCLHREKGLFPCHHARRSLTTLADPASTLMVLIKTTKLCQVESEWYGVTASCSENNQPVTYCMCAGGQQTDTHMNSHSLR